MNHWLEGQPHSSANKCKYQHQFNNQIFICRACNDRGESSIVIPKAGAQGDSTWVGIARYAWSGYTLECKFCGVIYRSRQYWYGNREPTEESVVRTEIQHVWPNVSISLYFILFINKIIERYYSFLSLISMKKVIMQLVWYSCLHS